MCCRQCKSTLPTTHFLPASVRPGSESARS
jgi:hypothetical protein